MKKLKRKQKRNLIILGVVLILIGFFWYSNNTFSILGGELPDFPYNYSLTSSDQKTSITYYSDDDIGYNTKTLYSKNPMTITTNNNPFIENDIFGYDYTVSSSTGDPTYVTPVTKDALILLDSLEIDSNLIVNFSFDYYLHTQLYGTSHTYCASSEKEKCTYHNKFILYNENKQITIIELKSSWEGGRTTSLEKSGNIKIERNLEGVGYYITSDGARDILTIPEGKYKLMYFSAKPQEFFTYNENQVSTVNYVKISNIILINSIQEIMIFRKINGICQSLVIKENEIKGGDFTTLQDCQDSLKISFSYLWIIGIIGLVVVLVIVYRKVKK